MVAFKLMLVLCLGAASWAQIVIDAAAGVTVHGQRPEAGVSCSGRMRVTRSPGVTRLRVFTRGAVIGVPRGVTLVVIRSGEGPVAVRGIDGMVDVEAAGGTLAFDGIGGGIRARTGGGEIRIGSANGRVFCYSGGGGITADRLGADAGIETAGGEVTIGEAAAAVRVSSGGGNIRVGRAGRLIAVTRAGSVEVGRSAGAVSARTGGGAIRLGPAEGVVEAVTRMGSIVAELVSPGGGSALEARCGDITVLLPSNIAVTVQARNEAAGPGGWVLSDFPEMEVLGGRWFPGREFAVIGAINGGGPMIRLSSGGVIRLRRR